MEQPKKPRGRKGGAPKENINARRGKETRIMISIRLDARIVKWLRSFPVGKRTDIIEQALIRQMDFEDGGLGVSETVS